MKKKRKPLTQRAGDWVPFVSTDMPLWTHNKIKRALIAAYKRGRDEALADYMRDSAGTLVPRDSRP